jgi:Flp pilus assembly protein CpaB
MKKRLQILLSLVFTISAAALVWLCWPVKAQVQQEEFLAAAKDISAGQRIKSEDVETITLPTGSLPTEYTCTAAKLEDQIAIIDIAAGELISKNHADKRPGGINYPFHKSGTRLMTIDLPMEMANGYWLAAGNRVDIDLISNRPDEAEPVISLENIEIAAVITPESIEKSAGRSNIAKPLICLALERKQAVLLAEAMVSRTVCLSVICPDQS